MNARNRHLINVLSTGILVMLVALIRALLGFAGICIWCGSSRCSGRRLPECRSVPPASFRSKRRTIPTASRHPSQLRTSPVSWACSQDWARPSMSFRICRWGPDSDVYQWERKEDGLRYYFDPSRGLMVYGKMSDDAGPERDNAPAVCHSVRRAGGDRRNARRGPRPIRVADLRRVQWGLIRRLSMIGDCGGSSSFSWRDSLVRKSPEIAEEGEFRPVQIGLL